MIYHDRLKCGSDHIELYRRETSVIAIFALAIKAASFAEDTAESAPGKPGMPDRQWYLKVW
jgi:hypothetical protein